MDDKNRKLEKLVELARQRGWGVFGLKTWTVKDMELVNCTKTFSVPEILFGDELGFMRALYQVDKEAYPTHDYHLARLSKMEDDDERIDYLSSKFISDEN